MDPGWIQDPHGVQGVMDPGSRVCAVHGGFRIQSECGLCWIQSECGLCWIQSECGLCWIHVSWTGWISTCMPVDSGSMCAGIPHPGGLLGVPRPAFAVNPTTPHDSAHLTPHPTPPHPRLQTRNYNLQTLDLRRLPPPPPPPARCWVTS